MIKEELYIDGKTIELIESLNPNLTFNIADIASDTRWMIFKVKQKAQQSYYDVTADTYDDNRFKFDIGQSKVKPKYSYNWPYDFFSLVELIQIEAETNIKAPSKPGGN